MKAVNQMSFALLCFIFCAFAQPSEVDWIMEDVLGEEVIDLKSPLAATPEELKKAIEDYSAGNFRGASLRLEQLVALHLPDGREDFANLMLAECYRKMNCSQHAIRHYRTVLDRGESQLAAAAAFRLLEFAYKEGNEPLGDSLLTIFDSRYKSSPLHTAVLYTGAKLYFRSERYGEAIGLLHKIPAISFQYFKAQFLLSLCYIPINKVDMSLSVLERILKTCTDKLILAEVQIAIGDILYSRDKTEAALNYYLMVSPKSHRYHDARVKCARIYLDEKKVAKARSIAEKYLKQHPTGEYFFEMASILSQVYTAEDNPMDASRVNSLIYQKVLNARTAVHISRELEKIYELQHSSNSAYFQAVGAGDSLLVKEIRARLSSLEKMEEQALNTLQSLGVLTKDRIEKGIAVFASRRYMTLLQGRIDSLNNILTALKEKTLKTADKNGVHAENDIVKSGKTLSDSLRLQIVRLEKEYEFVHTAGSFEESLTDSYTDEKNAKYIDWSYMHYQARLEHLRDLNREISLKNEANKDGRNKDVSNGKVTNAFVSNERLKMKKEISNERDNIITHLEMLLETGEKSRFGAEFLYRLAELYYDRASDVFDSRLQEYEKRLEQGTNSPDLQFPRYELDEVIGIYDRLINEYPKSRLADNAAFYKAQALRKVGKEKRANDVLCMLVEKYPESEYYVEANMSVGRYYFSNPKIHDNQGYQLAEEAFRRVLYYSDHPQFVEALYQLGWCYYMRDLYAQSIDIVKYMVKEIELDFDIADIDEKQINNPLLRGEAVDYIAISFDEVGGVEGAAEFLDMTENLDYAGMVLKRMGKLREEDLDYAEAISVYEKLLVKYPECTVAPYVAVDLIKLYTMSGLKNKILKQREDFISSYARGSAWQKRIIELDQQSIDAVDSMVISVGFSLADYYFRQGETNKDISSYEKAVENYLRMITLYPNDHRAVDAIWNAAVIFEKNLGDENFAARKYIEYSQKANADSSKREQAALNAVSLAQQFIASIEGQPESGPEISDTGLIVAAARNYLSLFPNGKKYDDVILSLGSFYFNRKEYDQAREVYRLVTSKKRKDRVYYEIRLLEGKCVFAKNKFIPAARVFEEVWKSAGTADYRQEAFNLMLQARYMYAKNLYEREDYAKAALAYTEIEDHFPNTEYGDIVLFNGAEAYDRMKDWYRACIIYEHLVKKYPLSKFAPDALFNAAVNYEKGEKWEDAARVYEKIIANYAESPKVKDAMFNVGFCYQRLGKLDKMAQANDRYSLSYPGERDVEALLLRSAKFYFEAGMFEKAKKVYKNFIGRFPKSYYLVEALVMVGRSYEEIDSIGAAVSQYSAAQKQNDDNINDGIEPDNFWAGEAAYRLARLRNKQFDEKTFDSATGKIDDYRKTKTTLLADAAKEYQRVVTYRSKRLFEAAFRIGEMYESYADDWYRYRTDIQNPIKKALNEKDRCLAASKLLQKSGDAFGRVLQMSDAADSLDESQGKWVDSAKAGIDRVYVKAGNFLELAVDAMRNAPVPSDISEKPLYFYQYQKQLLTTLEPMKEKIRSFYENAAEEMITHRLDSTYELCKSRYAYVSHDIAEDYDRLAQKLLLEADSLNKNSAQEDEEDLIFQFEDMAFELQDKALFAYEDALNSLRQKGMDGSIWYRKVLQRLAHLDPDTYGDNFYQRIGIYSDTTWFVRSDSVKDWNTSKPSRGWEFAETPSWLSDSSNDSLQKLIWGKENEDTVWFWKNAFLHGEPRKASLYVSSMCAYTLYINGVLTMSGRGEATDPESIDSLTGIADLLKGGDNIITCRGVLSDSGNGGIKVFITTLIDTTKHYRSKVVSPVIIDSSNVDTVKKTDEIKDSVDNIIVEVHPRTGNQEKRSPGLNELDEEIKKLMHRELEAEKMIEYEESAIKELRTKIDEIDKEIKSVTNKPVKQIK